MTKIKLMDFVTEEVKVIESELEDLIPLVGRINNGLIEFDLVCGDLKKTVKSIRQAAGSAEQRIGDYIKEENKKA